MSCSAVGPPRSAVSHSMRQRLLHSIEEITARQVQDLSVCIDEAAVAVHGVSRSFYVKQLVTQGVRKVAPHLRLRNQVRVCRN